jgi:hypothetical protein
VASDLQGVIVAIGKLHGSRGLGGQIKEFFKARSITDKIAGYQKSIQAKCETLKVGRMQSSSPEFIDTDHS